MPITVSRLRDDSPFQLPRRATPHSAGFDVRCANDRPIVMPPLTTWLFPTNMRLDIPPNQCVLVLPRSDCALRGITVANAPGLIDPDYQGELMLLMRNNNHDREAVVEGGNALAQLVPITISDPTIGFNLATATDKLTLPTTERGSGGFGSTGL